MDAIVDECIALIAPDAQHETECRRQIEAMITLLYRVKTLKIEPSSELLEKKKEKRRALLMNLKLMVGRRADREALLRFGAALANAMALLYETRHYLSVQLPDFDAAKFSKELETLITVAWETASSMRVKGGRPFDERKNTAAAWAKHLIENHGTTPLTLTIGGPYYELASVLYGAATDQHGADLSRHCKKVARRTKGRNKQL